MGRRGEGDRYLVSRGFVRDIFGVVVDVVHGVGHGGDVVFGCAGDGVVVNLVRHCVWCFVLVCF